MVCGYVYRAGSDGLSGSQVNTKTSLVFLGWFLFLDLLFFYTRPFLIGPEKDDFFFSISPCSVFVSIFFHFSVSPFSFLSCLRQPHSHFPLR